MTNWPIKPRSKKPRSKVSRGQTEGRGSRGDARDGEIAPDLLSCAMAPFLDRCPNTSRTVQGWSAEEINDDENALRVGRVFGVHADALCQSENRQGAGCRGRRLILRPLQQLRQLGDVGGDAPGFIAGEQISRRSASRFVLVLKVGQARSFLSFAFRTKRSPAWLELSPLGTRQPSP